MSCKELGCVVVTAQQVEVVGVDLDVSTNWKVSRADHLHVLIDVLVLLSGKEWTLNDTRVLLGGLEDRDGLVRKVVGDDESAVNILWNTSVESGCVSQDLFVVINVLEEVNLWLLWDQVVDVTKGVNLVSESIVWWNLSWDFAWGSWFFNFSEWEVTSESLEVVVLGEFVNTDDVENSSVGNQWGVSVDFVAGEISVTDEGLSWLVDSEGFWELLSSEIDGE